MKYAITGVTGKYGSKAMQTLSTLVPATDIIALARNTAKAKTVVPAGVEVRPGDYTDVETLTSSLQGVDRLLFVSSLPYGDVPRETQHLNVIKAAKNAGVSFIAYTSYPHAEQAHMPLAADHQATEKAIVAAGIAHSFLRNNWYLENEMGTINSALQTGTFVYPSDQGQIGWALESDYAEAGAKVLATTTPKAIYEFSGPVKTYLELAKAIENVSGKTLNVIPFDEASAKKSGMDDGTIGFIQLMQAILSANELGHEDSDLPEVLGRQLPSLEDALKTLI